MSEYTRREFGKWLGLGAAAAAGGMSGIEAMAQSAQQPATTRPGGGKLPNIVFLLNDHQAYYRHGWDRGIRIQRPNFERVAKQGIEFTRAYTACPLCSPARRSMLTGLLSHNHGEVRNGSHHPYDREVYLDTLASLGYQNFYYGKWHAGPGTAHDHKCEGFSYPGYNNPYSKPEYREYLKQRNLPEFEVRVDQNFMPEARNKTFGAKVGELLKIDKAESCNPHVTGIMTTPKDTHEAFFLANLACDQLKKLAADPGAGGKPFSLRVDFWGPHPPYLVAKEYADLYNPGDIPEYPSLKDDLKGKPECYHFENNLPMSEKTRLIQPSAMALGEWQKTIAYAYAHITMIDAAAGRVLDALDQLGLAENTIVIWTADHGDALACHGGHFDKSSYLPEEVMRIPMAMRWPGRIKGGQISEKLVSNMDVPPTLLDAAGTKFREPIDGRSLLPLAAGGDVQWRDDLMCDSYGHFDRVPGRVLVHGRYKYAAYKQQTHELYDLEADPYEMKNLVQDKDHQQTLADMRQRMRQWQERTGDKEVFF